MAERSIVTTAFARLPNLVITAVAVALVAVCSWDRHSELDDRVSTVDHRRRPAVRRRPGGAAGLVPAVVETAVDG